MAIRNIVVDDYDGKELPEDTPATRLVVDKTQYTIHLPETNKTELFKTLDPFIKGADTKEVSETARTTTTATRAKAAGSVNRDKLKRVRVWAQDTNFKFKRADGSETMLGDRGRIPNVIIEAYDKEHPDDA